MDREKMLKYRQKLLEMKKQILDRYLKQEETMKTGWLCCYWLHRNSFRWIRRCWNRNFKSNWWSFRKNERRHLRNLWSLW